jgi:cell division protein FtsI/penicillin-binding protein 2
MLADAEDDDFHVDIRGEENKATNELRHLAFGCHAKRMELFQTAEKKRRTRRYLQAGSGAIALVSGLLSGAIFGELLNGTTIKVFTALAGFFSGLITLILNTFVDNKEITEMYKGASEFRAVRDYIRVELSKADLTQKELEAALKKAFAEYGKLCDKFDHYLSSTGPGMMGRGGRQRIPLGAFPRSRLRPPVNG